MLQTTFHNTDRSTSLEATSLTSTTKESHLAAPSGLAWWCSRPQEGVERLFSKVFHRGIQILIKCDHFQQSQLFFHQPGGNLLASTTMESYSAAPSGLA